MIGDIACLGICIVDPETGICQGCGRGPEEVSGTAAAGNGATRPVGILAAHQDSARPQSAVQYPLPPQVTHQLETPSD
jgi:hypothetical protein